VSGPNSCFLAVYSLAVMLRFTSVAALLCAGESARIAKKKSNQATLGGVQVHNYREGLDTYILMFKQGTTDADIEKVCGGACNLVGHPSEGGAAFAQVHGTEETEKVVSANADKIQILEQDGTDSLIPELELEELEGVQAASASWGLERVGVPGRPSTGKGVHVYIQDTGIHISHQDFGGRAVHGLDVTSGSPVECAQTTARCAADGQGHGTHCAGSAAGKDYGVASGAYLHAIKTLSDRGSGARSWQMVGIDWVASSGKRPAVLSMSLGGSGRDPSYETVIGAAVEAGVVVVVAAGNSNADACRFSPAYTSTAITVGATTTANKRATYSNYGSCVNIMAPGSDIVSASHRSRTGSAKMSGTSMACPHVSGAAALLLAANPSWGADRVLRSMRATGRVGFIAGLKSNDPDVFLWVSGKPAR
jgi:subtilisin family serine protease